MTYRPREFWEQRLTDQFDLRGTGETSMSAAFNDACYALRREVLVRALADARTDVRGRTVLDIGCGTGFWTEFYTSAGANYTGVDFVETAVQQLRTRYPGATFLHGDVSEVELPGTFDVVNVFDVLYHITDDVRFDAALRRIAAAVKPGGLLLLTDLFSDALGLAEHNKMRSLMRYRAVLDSVANFDYSPLRPTHVLLHSNLGFWRFLNRAPALLLALDRTLLAAGAGNDDHHNRLLVARRMG